MKACVIGWPINHSRSPMIHRYWLKKHNFTGSYDKKAVKPDELDGFLANFKDSEFIGCNVTLPHKERVFSHPSVTIADEFCQSLGAVNTLYISDGKLHGMNTDGYGFLTNIESSITGWQAKGLNCLIIGAGGAARAIAASLNLAGAAKIIIANRSLDKAENIAAMIGQNGFSIGLADIASTCADIDLLINASTLGMTGQPALNIDISRLPKSAIVTDAVYSPLKTNLLQNAENNGHTIVDGLGMLLFQAVAGFEKWFGVKPVVTTELRDMVIADMALEHGKK